MYLLPLSVSSTLGNDKGALVDGVLVGQLTPTALTKGILSTHAQAVLCFSAEAGGLTFVNETTPANEATADDVELLGTTLAVNDAIYVGHATKKFSQVDFSITTQGDYTTTTFAHEYWNGSAWTALAGVSDGTTAFEAATGLRVLSFTVPSDWEQNTVAAATEGYWIRARCTATAATVTPVQFGQLWVVAQDADVTWTDDTTDINSAGAGDVALVPAHPAVGDAFYFGYSAKWCNLKLTWGTAGVATWTIEPQYWNGTTWTALTIVDDDTSGYTVAAGTKFVHFQPPSDWVANTALNGPNGEVGWFIRMAITAFTSLTTQPLGTQAWVHPLVTGAAGVRVPTAGSVSAIDCNAYTPSGSTADSKFMLLNVTAGTFIGFTWTKADHFVPISNLALTVAAGAGLALIQMTEDGTTEFADASFSITVT